MRDVTDDWRLVVECLNHVWWMTFCFSWRVVWKYVQLQHSDVILCTEWTNSDSFPAPCSVCMWHFVRFLIISRCDENTCGDQVKPVNPVEPIAFARTKATRIPCREPMFSPSPEHEGVDRLLQQDQITRQIKEGLQAGTDSTVAQCQLQSPS